MIRTLSEKQINKLKMVLASKDKFYDETEVPYLKEICDAIQEFENDDNEALIICMPPRHRKDKNSK